MFRKENDNYMPNQDGPETKEFSKWISMKMNCLELASIENDLFANTKIDNIRNNLMHKEML